MITTGVKGEGEGSEERNESVTTEFIHDDKDKRVMVKEER